MNEDTDDPPELQASLAKLPPELWDTARAGFIRQQTLLHGMFHVPDAAEVIREILVELDFTPQLRIEQWRHQMRLFYGSRNIHPSNKSFVKAAKAEIKYCRAYIENDNAAVPRPQPDSDGRKQWPGRAIELARKEYRNYRDTGQSDSDIARAIQKEYSFAFPLDSLRSAVGIVRKTEIR